MGALSMVQLEGAQLGDKLRWLPIPSDSEDDHEVNKLDRRQDVGRVHDARVVEAADDEQMRIRLGLSIVIGRIGLQVFVLFEVLGIAPLLILENHEGERRVELRVHNVKERDLVRTRSTTRKTSECGKQESIDLPPG